MVWWLKGFQDVRESDPVQTQKGHAKVIALWQRPMTVLEAGCPTMWASQEVTRRRMGQSVF